MRVAAIILNYKTWQDTLNEVNILKNILDESQDAIIIVDNASPNESAEILKKQAEKYGYTFIASQNNSGYAAGNNIGLRYAKEKNYKFGWIINNDILIFDKDILEPMLFVFEKDQSVASVNPDVYSPDGHMFNRDSKRFSFWDLTFGMFRYSKKGRKLSDVGGYGYIYRPQGCCMILDLDKAEEVGYLDEHTFLYSEEIIYAERLLKKGYRCACVPTTKIIHNHSKTVRSNIDEKRIRNIQMESFRYYLSTYRKYGILMQRICVAFYVFKLKIIG